MPSGYVVNLKNPKDSPEEIADKLNTLAYAIDVSVIKGAVPREEFETLQKKTHGYINSSKERIDNTDLRWHGAGMHRVYHDDSLSGDGTVDSPLSVVADGGLSLLTATGTVDGMNATFVFTSAPSIVFRDGAAVRKVASDGTVNWTGTTNITLAIPPNFDIFAV